MPPEPDAAAPARAPAAVTSAETVAALRAMVAKESALAVPCDDQHARHFLGLKHRLLTTLVPTPLLRRIANRLSPGSYCFAITRTRHFDRLLLDEIAAGVEQVVVLGAGYDSRAWRFAAALREIPIYEIDHPGTQARKRRLVARHLGDRDNVVYLPVDFTRTSFATALADAGFSRSKRTFFLWEGVSYYLPRAVVSTVLDVVAGLAAGSSIAFDYALAAFVAGDHGSYGGREVARWLEKVGEPFLFGLDPADTRGFLAGHGLDVCSDLGPAELEDAYLATRAGGLLGKTFGHLRIVHARVPAAPAPPPREP